MIEFLKKNFRPLADLSDILKGHTPPPPLYALVRNFETPSPPTLAYVLIECPLLRWVRDLPPGKSQICLMQYVTEERLSYILSHTYNLFQSRELDGCAQGSHHPDCL